MTLVEDGLHGLGFLPGQGAAGEVVLLRPGGAQVHLGIVTARGFVHADAGLGRVVESPWRADWDVAGFWSRETPSPAQTAAESPLPDEGDL